MSNNNTPLQTSALQLTNISQTYRQGGKNLRVLNNVNLAINQGETIALVGASGSGKSTLLHLAGLLETPTAGSIHCAGIDATKANDKTRTKLRGEHLGFVYQAHRLLPDFSALENVVLPCLLQGLDKTEATTRAEALLDRLGLGERLQHRPMLLSGGEQQRVAIARALVLQPKVLLADEPTGNLDPDTASRVFDLFLELVAEAGLALLMATHNPGLAEKLQRQVRLEGGQLVTKQAA